MGALRNHACIAMYKLKTCDRYIVVDEGHRLKNMNCKLIKEVVPKQSLSTALTPCVAPSVEKL